MTEKPRPDSPKAQYLYQSNTEPRDIRVLRLQRGVWTDPLRCTLYQAHIDETPTYEALSYVWGDPTPKHTLICEGQEMPIAENLHTALLYLRHEDNPCWLWIDAICINQQDIEERNRQARLMSEIYYEAGGAMIWRGEEDETTTEGVAILERLEQKVIDAQSHVPLRFDFDRPDAQWCLGAIFAIKEHPKETLVQSNVDTTRGLDRACCSGALWSKDHSMVHL